MAGELQINNVYSEKAAEYSLILEETWTIHAQYYQSNLKEISYSLYYTQYANIFLQYHGGLGEPIPDSRELDIY